MEFSQSPLQREVTRVISDGKSSAYYSYLASLIIEDKRYNFVKVISLDIVREYYDKTSDYINLVALVPGGTYVKRIYPNRNNLKVEISRIPLAEVGSDKDLDRSPRTTVYKAVMEDTGNPRIEQNAMNVPDEAAMNLTNLLDIRFQLLDLTYDKLRKIEIGNIYRQLDNEEVMKTVLNEVTTKISIDKEIAGFGVDIVPMKDKSKREHIIIPQGLKAIDLPSYLQEKCGGIYPTGLGQYLQDGFWYIFPKFDYKRFQEVTRTATIINVPAKLLPNIERTYLEEGSDLTILATGVTRFKDNTVIEKKQDGNGGRVTSAEKVFEGFTETKDNKTVAKRKENNKEFIVSETPDKENHAPTEKNSITDNVYTLSSKLAGREGFLIALTWQNSIPSLIYPGMMVKILYLDEFKVREVIGCVIKTHHFSHPEAAGVIGHRYLTHTGLSIFVENTLDYDRLVK